MSRNKCRVRGDKILGIVFSIPGRDGTQMSVHSNFAPLPPEALVLPHLFVKALLHFVNFRLAEYAESKKNEGNEAYKKQNYTEALRLYTIAIGKEKKQYV